ncbi:MAG: hypothetical protein RTV41_02580 [Candidatus Thorarchaeota archaeon]
MVGDLSLSSIDSGENLVDILLDQVLTPTDVRIIDVIADLRNKRGKTPTASDIQDELSKSYRLKKTQLYERLNRLSRLGFLSVKQLPRPRRYIVSNNTIINGVERWVEEQRVSIASLSSELDVLLKYLKGVNTQSFASALTEKFSSGFEST